MLIENGRLSLGRRNSASEGCREETGGKVLFDMLYMQIEVCFVPICIFPWCIDLKNT